MIDKNSIRNIYDILIDGYELTTKNLNNLGLNSKDIKELIEQDKLERVKRGYYEITHPSDLYYYGKEYLDKYDYEKAGQCFLKCYELEPNHGGACFQLFLRCIIDKDYDNAFKYYDGLSNVDSQEIIADSNFYMYLLSIITKVPEKYENVRYLTFEDYKICDNTRRHKNIKEQNDIRSAAYYHKFSYAYTLLNDLYRKNNSISVYDLITRYLLKAAVDQERISKNYLLEYVNNKSYDKIIEHLDDKDNKHDLSKYEIYVQYLAKTLYYIKENDTVLYNDEFETNDIFVAIKNNNFKLALKISSQYNDSHNVSSDDNIITLLLTDICEYIDKLEKSKKKVSYAEVYECLVKGNLEEAFKLLNQYMKSIDKIQYEFLIVNLIKLSVQENDLTYTRAMKELLNISNPEYECDIKSYLQEFYFALSRADFIKTSIYLDIISKYNNMMNAPELTKKLLEVFNNTQEIFGNHSKSIKDNLIEQNNKNELVKDDAYDSINEYIKNKHQLLVNGQGIIVLKNMNDEKRQIIHKIVSKYRDMVSFEIGNAGHERIVLRYRPFLKDKIDVKDLSKKGYNYYVAGNYEECINAYKTLLQFGTPRAYVYASLGLSYMKKGDLKVAIDYLEISTELSRKEDNFFDFTELVAKLKGVELEYKPYVKMDVEEFESNPVATQLEYEEIKNYIIESGLDVESSCLKLGMTLEQIDTIKLLFAIDYYTQGAYEKGDQFLKSFVQSKHKIEDNLKLYNDIIKNKKFYINRKDENQKTLKLTLQPNNTRK